MINKKEGMKFTVLAVLVISFGLGLLITLDHNKDLSKAVFDSRLTGAAISVGTPDQEPLTAMESGTGNGLEPTVGTATANEPTPTSPGGSLSAQNLQIQVAATPNSCGDVGASLTISGNIRSNNTCFTITANNVVLDGNGSTITGNATGYGVSITGFDNVTIRNFAGLNNFSIGVAFLSGGYHENGSIYNNTILVNVSRSNPLSVAGIYVNSAYGFNISNNVITVVGNSSSSAGAGVELNSINSSKIFSNVIKTTLESSNGAIYIHDASDNNNVTSNRIDTYYASPAAASAANGIRLGVSTDLASKNRNNLSFNNITVSGMSGSGIELIRSRNNLVAENNITIISNCTLTCAGILLSNSTYSVIHNNTIIVSNQSVYGMELEKNSSYNNITSNTLISYSGHAIYLNTNGSEPNTDNNVSYNMITVSGTSALGISLSSSLRATIGYNNITSYTNNSGGNTGAITLDGTNYSNIFYNTIEVWNQTMSGVYFSTASSNNNVTGNTITTHWGSDQIGIRAIFLNNNLATLPQVNNNLSFNIINIYGAEGVGIELRYNTNTTVYSNTIYHYGNASNSNGEGIFLRWTNRSTLINNTLHIFNGSEGISLEVSDQNRIIGNNVSLYSYARISNNGIGLIGSRGNTILGNNITSNYNGSGFTGGGISLSGSNSTTIDSNIIVTWNSSFSGISLITSSSNNTISFNRITSYGTSGHGIYFAGTGSGGSAAVNDNNASSNQITMHGEQSAGIYNEASWRNLIENNTVNSYSNYSGSSNGVGGGITIFDSNSTIVRYNFVRTFNQSTSAFRIERGSNDNNITSNVLNATGEDANAIYLDDTGTVYPHNNVFLNNNITSTNKYEILDDTGNTYTNYLIYNNSWGEVRWTDLANGGFLKDLDLNVSNDQGFGLGRNLFMGNNTFALNTSAFLADLTINSSANITLRGVALNWTDGISKADGYFTDRVALLGNGSRCVDCYVLNYSNTTNILVFNASAFSSYTGIQDQNAPTITNPAISRVIVFQNRSTSLTVTVDDDAAGISVVLFQIQPFGNLTATLSGTTATLTCNASNACNTYNLSWYNWTGIYVNDSAGRKNSSDPGLQFNVTALPILRVQLYHPVINTNFTANQTNAFTVNVSCSNGDCGQINVSLDPANITNTLEVNRTFLDGLGTVFSGNNLGTNGEVWVSHFVGFSTGQAANGSCYEITNGGTAATCLGAGAPNLPCIIIAENVTNASTGNQFEIWSNQAQCQASIAQGPKKFTLVSITSGTKPFWVNSTNPVSISLNQDQSQLVTWYVNATGQINSNHTFSAFANITSDMTVNANTSDVNITIVFDAMAPIVTLYSPAAGSVNSSATPININFICNVTDNIMLSNLSLYLTNFRNQSLVFNRTAVVNGTSNSTNWSMTFNVLGNYSWTCVGQDNASNIGFGANRTLVFNYTDSAPATTLVSPANNYANTTDTTVTIDFNCNATDDVALVNISLYLTNSSNQSLTLNRTTVINGTSNATNWSITFNVLGNYSWNCLTYDSAGSSDFDNNRSFTLNFSDSAPITLLASPINNYANTTAAIVTINFTCNATDDIGLRNISLYLTNSSNQSLTLNRTTVINGTSNATNWSITFNVLGNYSWNCLSYDSAGSSDFDNNRSFTLNYTTPASSAAAAATSSSSSGEADSGAAPLSAESEEAVEGKEAAAAEISGEEGPLEDNSAQSNTEDMAGKRTLPKKASPTLVAQALALFNDLKNIIKASLIENALAWLVAVILLVVGGSIAYGFKIGLVQKTSKRIIKHGKIILGIGLGLLVVAVIYLLFQYLGKTILNLIIAAGKNLFGLGLWLVPILVLLLGLLLILIYRPRKVGRLSVPAKFSTTPKTANLQRSTAGSSGRKYNGHWGIFAHSKKILNVNWKKLFLVLVIILALTGLFFAFFYFDLGTTIWYFLNKIILLFSDAIASTIINLGIWLAPISFLIISIIFLIFFGIKLKRKSKTTL